MSWAKDIEKNQVLTRLGMESGLIGKTDQTGALSFEHQELTVPRLGMRAVVMSKSVNTVGHILRSGQTVLSACPKGRNKDDFTSPLGHSILGPAEV